MLPTCHTGATIVNQEQVEQCNLADVLMKSGQLFRIYNLFIDHDC